MLQPGYVPIQLDCCGNPFAQDRARNPSSGRAGLRLVAPEAIPARVPSKPRIPLCGDGSMVGGEQCDDRNRDNGDGCSNACMVECGYACSGSPSSCVLTGSSTGPGCAPTCGDGLVTIGEECDLGVTKNVGDYNGCNSDCTLGPFCGDGIVDESCGESCDDGANIGGYGYCKASCTRDSYCGDGIVDEAFGETCDEGDNNSDAPGSRCNERCGRPAICGDGTVQETETCDDGINDGKYGGCTSDCRFGPYCGDGVRNGPEQCDYGAENEPLTSGLYGSCLVNCQLGPHCGDGTVQPLMEQCDHGQQTIGCSSECMELVAAP